MILTFPNTNFFVQTSENGQILASEHHFERSGNLFFISCLKIIRFIRWVSILSFLKNLIFLFMYVRLTRVYPLSTNLRYLRTHFFILTFENGSSLASKQHFEISAEPYFFFHLNISKWLDLNLRAQFWDIFESNFLFEHLKMTRYYS